MFFRTVAVCAVAVCQVAAEGWNPLAAAQGMISQVAFGAGKASIEAGKQGRDGGKAATATSLDMWTSDGEHKEEIQNRLENGESAGDIAKENAAGGSSESGESGNSGKSGNSGESNKEWLDSDTKKDMGKFMASEAARIYRRDAGLPADPNAANGVAAASGGMGNNYSSSSSHGLSSATALVITLFAGLVSQM